MYHLPVYTIWTSGDPHIISCRALCCFWSLPVSTAMQLILCMSSTQQCSVLAPDNSPHALQQRSSLVVSPVMSVGHMLPVQVDELLCHKDSRLGTAAAQILTHAANYMLHNANREGNNDQDDTEEDASKQMSFAEKLKPQLLQLCSSGPPQAAKAAIRWETLCNKLLLLHSGIICDACWQYRIVSEAFRTNKTATNQCVIHLHGSICMLYTHFIATAVFCAWVQSHCYLVNPCAYKTSKLCGIELQCIMNSNLIA